MKYTVENITKGPKGFHDKVSGLVMLDAGGKAAEVEFGPGEKDSAEDSGYFKVTSGKAKDDDPEVTDDASDADAADPRAKRGKK